MRGASEADFFIDFESVFATGSLMAPLASERLDHAFFQRPHCGLSSIVDVELAQNILHVLFDGLNADPKRLADFTIA